MNAVSTGVRLGAWDLAIGGYAAATLGLLIDLPTIGASGTSAAVSIGIAVLIGIGILMAAAGMLRVRRALGAGLIVFLFGVFGLQISSSLSGFLVSAAFVVVAAAVEAGGVVLLRRHPATLGSRSRAPVSYLVVGTTLIFVGVVVIIASKIGYYFVFPDVTSTVVNDVGAAVSASGCVVAAYSSFVIRGLGRQE